MKINQEQLLWGLDIVGRAVARRSTLPILTHVLIDVNKDGLTLAANNLDMAIACGVSAQVGEEWALTIPYRLLADYVGTLEGEIVLEKEDHKLRLSCDRQLAHINGMEKDEFPTVPVYEGEISELSPGIVKDMLVRTLIAASPDDYRPVLAGVLLSTDGKEIKTTAADGFRLSKMNGTQDWELQAQTALIPARAVAEVLRISDKLPDEVIRMGLSETRAFFEIGTVRLCVGLIEGVYPDVSQIIPESWDTQIVVPTKELLRALKVLKPFVSEIISLEVKEDKIRLVPVTTEESSAECKIDASVTGEKLKIGLNIGFLIDVLKVVPTETVVFEMGKSSSPVLIRPEGMETFTHIIMPASLSQGG